MKRQVPFLVVSVLSVVGFGSPALADTTINTGNDWLTTSTAPPTGWQNVAFDDSGWNPATLAGTPIGSDIDSILIWDGSYTGGPTQAWFRKTFTLSGGISSALFHGIFDDDGEVYVNGVLVYADSGALAGPYINLDLTSDLSPGSNVIAAHGIDFGGNKLFGARLVVQSTVPEPASLTLFFIRGYWLLGRRSAI